MVSKEFVMQIQSLLFPVKLYRLAHSKEIKSIYWSRGGSAIRLDTEILPEECFDARIFNVADCKHVFRQLSYYRFYRTERVGPVWEFQHPLFHADRFDLVQTIKRIGKKNRHLVSALEIEPVLQFVERRKSSRLQKKETQKVYKEESDTEIWEQDYDNKPRTRRSWGRKLAEHEKEEENLVSCDEISDEESWKPEAIHKTPRNRRGRKKKLPVDEIKGKKSVLGKGESNEETVRNCIPRNNIGRKKKLEKHEKEEQSRETKLHKDALSTTGYSQKSQNSFTPRNRSGSRSKKIEHENPKEICLKKLEDNCQDKPSIRRGRKKKLDECDVVKKENGVTNLFPKENKLKNVVCKIETDLEVAPKFKRSRGRPRKDQTAKLSHAHLQKNDKVVTFTCRAEIDFQTPTTFSNEKKTKRKFVEQRTHVREIDNHTKLPEVKGSLSDKRPKRSTSGKDLSLLRKHMENLNITERYNESPYHATTKTIQGIEFPENPGTTFSKKSIEQGIEDPSRHATLKETNDISTSMTLHSFMCKTTNNQVDISKIPSSQDFAETLQNSFDHSYRKSTHSLIENYDALGKLNEQSAFIVLKPEKDSVDIGRLVKLEKVEDPLFICGNLVSGNVYKCMPVDPNNLCGHEHKVFSEKDINIVQEDITPSATKSVIEVPTSFFARTGTLEEKHQLASCVPPSNCTVIKSSINEQQTNTIPKNVDSCVQTESIEEVLVASKKEITQPEISSSPELFRGAQISSLSASNFAHSQTRNTKYSVRCRASRKKGSVKNKQCSQLECSRDKGQNDHSSKSLPAELTSDVARGNNLVFAKQAPRICTFANDSSKEKSFSNHLNVPMESMRHGPSEDIDLGSASEDENERFLKIYRKQLDPKLLDEKKVMSPVERGYLTQRLHLLSKNDINSILDMFDSRDPSVMELVYEFLTSDIDSCISFLENNFT